MISEAWSTSNEQGSLGIGTGSISDRAGRDSWLELRDCPFSRESSSFEMESSPSAEKKEMEESEEGYPRVSLPLHSSPLTSLDALSHL